MRRLRDDRTFVHSIDRQNVIVSLNSSWLDFAQENGAPELISDAVIGRSLWDFIEGWEVRYIYDLIIRKVREERVMIRVPFRCDSPDRRRFIDMDVVPSEDSEGEIDFRCRIVRLEERPPVGILEKQVRTHGVDIRICSWCKRMNAEGGRWGEVETALQSLRLHHDLSRTRLSHDVCPSCRVTLMQAVRPLQPL